MLDRSAAPTAGLHFSTALLVDLEARGIDIQRVTLHVGVGTFRPIKAESLDDHVMHAEWCEVDGPVATKLRETRQGGGRVVAVGTTTVRTLESAARESGEIAAWKNQTDLFIRPPWEFRCVDALITNFHLPRSSLLVLLHAFGGSELMQQAYREAVTEEYRFYSYGDAMLVV